MARGKTDVMFEEVVDVKIDEATLGRMLEVLRRHFGNPGKLEHEGGAKIWSTTADTTRRIYLTVVEDEEQTRLRLEEHMPTDARVTVGSGTLGGGIGGFMLVVPLKALVVKAVLLMAMGPLALGGATIGWLGGRALWKRRAARREQGLRRALGEILDLARRKALPAGDPTH